MVRYQRSLLLALVLITAISAHAQRAPGGGGRASIPSTPTSPAELRVQVVLMNDRPLQGLQLHVELVSSRGAPAVESTFTNVDGRATLRARPGQYRLRVTGPDVEETVTELFTIEPRATFHSEFVQVKLRESAKSGGAPGGMVSAAELNIPEKARKESNKGVDALNKGDLRKAIEHLEKAVAEYPKYDMAYNNLGVAHTKLGDQARGREMFEKALSLNDKNASAGRNLARLCMLQEKPDQALMLIERALAAEPHNPESLTLASTIYLSRGELAKALAAARRAHDSPHEPYPVVHLIAAGVLERLNQLDEAAAEYKLFLKESPEGPSAPAVRKALARLEQR